MRGLESQPCSTYSLYQYEVSLLLLSGVIPLPPPGATHSHPFPNGSEANLGRTQRDYSRSVAYSRLLLKATLCSA